jgi:signal transduction histidine kinase
MMATRIEYRGRPAIMGNIIDITERKRVEEELREMIRRMEIAGEQSIIYARELNREIADRKRTEQKLLTYHEKLRSLASALALTEERERHRIAIEVHDHIAQKLAFAKIKLGTLRASTSSTSLAGTTDEIMELVNEIIQDIRSLISQLSSPILYELGFVPAVEWLAQETRKRHGILVEFADDGQPKPLSDDVCVLLFQAVRELLVNVAKHAQARSAKVSITRDGTHIEVDVEDDGVGFDTGKLAPSVDENGRFGLFSIRARLDPLGGHIEVESEPGHGTRVTLMAPLKGNGEYKKEKVS